MRRGSVLTDAEGAVGCTQVAQVGSYIRICASRGCTSNGPVSAGLSPRGQILLVGDGGSFGEDVFVHETNGVRKRMLSQPVSGRVGRL